MFARVFKMVKVYIGIPVRFAYAECNKVDCFNVTEVNLTFDLCGITTAIAF